MGYYSAIKRSKIVPFAELRMDLESVIQSEVCQKEGNKQFSSVAQSCPTLCNPMNHSSPGFPVHQQLLELAQTLVHQVGDAIQPSHPLSPPSPPAFNLSQPQGLFQWVSSSQSIGASTLASVLPMNIQGWFPLGLTDFFTVQGPLKSLLQLLQFESINSSALSLPYGPTLTSVNDYRKKHSFHSMDLCQQSDVSAF